MPQCEMCGQEAGLVQADIEGTEMLVCRNCSQFGKVKEFSQPQTKRAERIFKKPVRSEPHLEITENIVLDYAQKIRRARERLGLNQEDFAQKINEKGSLLHKMETGSFEPSLSLARKLERMLNIVLIEKIEEKKVISSKTPAESFTIGDMIKK